MSERNLTIPTGANSHPTGQIGLGKGSWQGDIDHRHYFRDEVFSALPWQQDRRTRTRVVTAATFEVWVEGEFMGEAELRISHNTNTASTTYKQKNHMTHLSWGAARPWIAKPELLGARLKLEREVVPPGDLPRFRISIDQ